MTKSMTNALKTGSSGTEMTAWVSLYALELGAARKVCKAAV